MKLQKLINRLAKLKEKHGNIEVILEYDDGAEFNDDSEGCYALDIIEKIELDDGDFVINLGHIE